MTMLLKDFFSLYIKRYVFIERQLFEFVSDNYNFEIIAGEENLNYGYGEPLHYIVVDSNKIENILELTKDLTLYYFEEIDLYIVANFNDFSCSKITVEL